jgi:hypothetical protein
MMKPDHMLETIHLQMLIDDTQNPDLWGIFGNLYGFRNGEVDDRTGEIFCPARDVVLETYDSDGKVIDE